VNLVHHETEMLLYFADAVRNLLGLERLYTGRDPIEDPHRLTVEDREYARFDVGTWGLPKDDESLGTDHWADLHDEAWQLASYGFAHKRRFRAACRGTR
jgi:hypothetical protein